jgi:Mor family transcriptional regulator
MSDIPAAGDKRFSIFLTLVALEVLKSKGVPHAPAVALAMEITELFCSRHHGDQLYVDYPGKDTVREQTKEILAEFNGTNYREIAIKLGISERNVRLVVERNQREKNNGERFELTPEVLACLTPAFRRFVEIIGTRKAQAIMREHSGSQIYIGNGRERAGKLVSLIGQEAMEKLHSTVPPGLLHIPSMRSLKTNCRTAEIRKRFEAGEDIRALAAEYRLVERRIYQITHRSRNPVNRGDGETCRQTEEGMK